MKALRNFLLIIITVSLISLMILTSCKDKATGPVTNNEDSCGEHVNRGDSWIGPSFGGNIPDTYTLGSERYFNFYKLYDSICTDHHVGSTFFAEAYDSVGRQINFRAAIEWQIFYERTDTGTITYEKGMRRWRSNIYDVGLKQAFGEDPGKVFVNVYAHFPTLGSEEEDRAYLSRNLVITIISCDMYLHKP